MKVNYIFLLVTLLAIPFCASQYTTCKEKGLFSDSNQTVLISNDGDVNKAYNGIGSCATLTTDNDDGFCCYMKLKIKNNLYDEKYTQKGCYELRISDYLDLEDGYEFGDLIKDIEAAINEKNKNIHVQDADIVSLDCSSKFIQLLGISLLFLLL